MLEKKINNLFKLIKKTKSLVFLYNDIQHQGTSYTPHETLPAILQELELYKSLWLSPVKIMELQQLGKKYNVAHSFINEPATGIIIPSFKEKFLNALQSRIEEEVHKAVGARVSNLTQSLGSDQTLKNEVEQGICSLLTQKPSNLTKISMADVFNSALEDFNNLPSTGTLQDFAALWGSLKTLVACYPDISSQTGNTSFDTAKSLLTYIETLQTQCNALRKMMGEAEPSQCAQLIDNTNQDIKNNIIYQIATALDEIPQLKEQLKRKAPSKQVTVTPNRDNDTLAIALYKKLQSNTGTSLQAIINPANETLFHTALTALKKSTSLMVNGQQVDNSKIQSLLKGITYKNTNLDNYADNLTPSP